MKFKPLLFILLIMYLAACKASQQSSSLSEEEYQEWEDRKEAFEDRISNMSVEEFKEFQERRENLESENSDLQSQISSLESTMSEKDARISELESQVESLQEQLEQAKSQVSTLREENQKLERNISVSRGEPTDTTGGVVFKVQIGAFRNKDLEKYFEKSNTFGGMTEDGIHKYTLGSFRDYWEADTFKKYLREMGVNDAWIVPYKNGKRVPLKDVLEGIIQ